MSVIYNIKVDCGRGVRMGAGVPGTVGTPPSAGGWRAQAMTIRDTGVRSARDGDLDTRETSCGAMRPGRRGRLMPAQPDQGRWRRRKLVMAAPSGTREAYHSGRKRANFGTGGFAWCHHRPERMPWEPEFGTIAVQHVRGKCTTPTGHLGPMVRMRCTVRIGRYDIWPEWRSVPRSPSALGPALLGGQRGRRGLPHGRRRPLGPSKPSRSTISGQADPRS